MVNLPPYTAPFLGSSAALRILGARRGCSRTGHSADDLECGEIVDIHIAVFIQIGALAPSDIWYVRARHAVCEDCEVNEIHQVVTVAITWAGRGGRRKFGDTKPEAADLERRVQVGAK